MIRIGSFFPVTCTIMHQHIIELNSCTFVTTTHNNHPWKSECSLIKLVTCSVCVNKCDFNANTIHELPLTHIRADRCFSIFLTLLTSPQPPHL